MLSPQVCKEQLCTREKTYIGKKVASGFQEERSVLQWTSDSPSMPKQLAVPSEGEDTTLGFGVVRLIENLSGVHSQSKEVMLSRNF